MEIRYRLYPYPVLAPFLHDVYKTSRFEADANIVHDGYSTSIQFTASLKNAELEELIRSKKACFVYHLECSQTGFRKAVKTYKLNESYVLSSKNVRGRLQICPFIVALDDIENFTSEDFADDYYGMKFFIEAGCVLAVSGQQITADISDNLEDLADVPSIFSIIQNHDETVKQMKVDYSNNKIVISLPYNDYFSFKSLNSNAAFQPVLNSLTVIPALVIVIEAIKNTDSQTRDEFAEDYGWYRTIRKTLKERFDCDIDAGGLDEQDPLELAQKLINNPLTDALEVLASGTESEEGDSE